MAAAVSLEVLEAMQEMSPGDPGFVFRVIDAFLKEVPERLIELRSHQTNGQAEAMGQAAHALASSAQNMGLEALAALCSKLDRLGRGGSLQNSDELVSEITAAFGEAKRSLEQFVTSHALT